MIKAILFLLLVLCLFVNGSFAQNHQGDVGIGTNCGARSISDLDPEERAQHEALNRKLAFLIKHGKVEQREERSILTIPVVWHIFHEGLDGYLPQSRIDTAMAWLNDAFRARGYYNNGLSVDTEIEFCLVQRDPEGRPTTGINYVRSEALRTYVVGFGRSIYAETSQYDTERFLNIYSSRFVASLGGIFAGVASFPTNAGMPGDAIYMDNNYVGTTLDSSAVLAHEVGHYLGLYHTFEGGCVNNDCLTDGDRICDTPPDNSRNFGSCDAPDNSCDTDALSGFPSDVPDRSDNYMDYREWGCLRAFTPDQVTRMRDVLETVRSGLLDNVIACTPADPTLELCGNGYDDDGDGLVDCFDEDCTCLANEGCVPDSIADYTRFAIREAWHTTRNVVAGSQPIVASLDVTDNAIPDIVVTRNEQFVYLFAGDGSSDEFNPPTLFADTDLPQGIGAPVVLDLEGDGFPELLLPSKNLLTSYNMYSLDSSPVMTTIDMLRSPTVNSEVPLQFADFDNDGKTELYQLSTIFTRANPSYDAFADWTDSLSAPAMSRYSSTAADVLSVADCGGDQACAGLELIDGANVYAVDLPERFGGISDMELRYTVSDRLPAFAKTTNTIVADLNLDGIPDIVTATSEKILIYNTRGLFLEIPFFASTQQDEPSLPCVAEVYDERVDGFRQNMPELIIATPGMLNCFSLNANGGGVRIAWQIPTNDLAGRAAATAFDFDANGAAELVYRDTESLRVIYGGPLPIPVGVSADRSIARIAMPSTTGSDYPVIADIDNDGQAEIVVTAGEDDASDMRLFVFEADTDQGDAWTGTRSFWNAYGYHPLQVNDDLTVPRYQQAQWQEISAAGSDNRPYNVAGVNLPLLNADFEPVVSSIDLSIEVTSVSCDEDGAELIVEFFNVGNIDAGREMPFSVFQGDPRRPGASLVYQDEVVGPQPAGTSQVSIFTIPALTSGTYWIVVNIDEDATVPIDLQNDSDQNRPECAYVNNITSFTYTGGVPQLVDLGSDIIACDAERLQLSTPDIFDRYVWSDGSVGATLIPDTSGTYWLEGTDVCGNTDRDSIVVTLVTAEAFDIGDDVAVCPGDSVTINASGFSEYAWSSDSPLPCLDCSSVTIRPVVPTTYTVAARDQNQCQVVDSISVDVFTVENPNLIDSLAACFGESLFFDAGDFSTFQWTSVSGCDTCQVASLDVVEAALVGVRVVDMNGCSASDSSFVSVIPQPSLAIDIDPADCALDGLGGFRISSLDSANFRAQGLDSLSSLSLKQISQGSYPVEVDYLGCVDTVLVIVPEENERSEQEVVQLCEAGFPFLWRGESIIDTGMYEQRIQQVQGCDSVFQITVLPLNDTLLTEVDTALCVGDRFTFRSTEISGAGVYDFRIGADRFCPDIERLSVRQGDVLTLDIPSDTSVVRGRPLLLLATGQDTLSAHFSWTPQELFTCPNCASTSARLSQDVTINLEVISPDGCDSSAELMVELLDGDNFYIPNAFSPNGDGTNDRFTIYAGASVELIRSIQIFSRKGNLVFERRNFTANDESLGWDGFFAGELLNPGVFVYLIELLDSKQGEIVLEGDLTLVR